jgi:hypothetical protein
MRINSSNDNVPGGWPEHSEKIEFSPSVEGEIAALVRSEFIIGTTPIIKIPSNPQRPMWVRYQHAGKVFNRAYRSAGFWRAKVKFALKHNEPFEALEFDEWGRLKDVFPRSVKTRLDWNAQQLSDPFPAARLFDPFSEREMLLFRSRLKGHAVDALHNFADCGWIFQSIWIADIFRLHPLLGIKLVRDEAFASDQRLSAHIAAVAEP